MLIVISPAKSLDYESPVRTRRFTQPDFLTESERLIGTLRGMSAQDLSTLMSISPTLGKLNHERVRDWQLPFDADNARQALFAFKGDVYLGLEAQSFEASDVTYAQHHLRILSGLYGLLRPLDLIQPYRLEMGTRLNTERGKSLYEFWGSRITDALNAELEHQRSRVLINLASNEYFKAVKSKDLAAEVISPVFKDYKGGQYKLISFFAKRARGLMSAYIIRNRIDNARDLPSFDIDGYRYSEKDSTPASPVFLRRAAE